MDPFHVYVLHSTFSGVQFQKEFALRPTVEWEYMSHGVAYVASRKLPDDRVYRRVAQVLMPNVRVVPTPERNSGPGREVAWLVPGDDGSHRSFGVARVGAGEDPVYERRSRLVQHEGKIWAEMTEEEHQRYPDDFEAQVGQGSITLHSEEHLATTDRGIVMMRRLLREQIRAVQAGGDPVGAGPGASELVVTRAGNFFD